MTCLKLTLEVPIIPMHNINTTSSTTGLLITALTGARMPQFKQQLL